MPNSSPASSPRHGLQVCSRSLRSRRPSQTTACQIVMHSASSTERLALADEWSDVAHQRDVELDDVRPSWRKLEARGDSRPGRRAMRKPSLPQPRILPAGDRPGKGQRVRYLQMTRGDARQGASALQMLGRQIQRVRLTHSATPGVPTSPLATSHGAFVRALAGDRASQRRRATSWSRKIGVRMRTKAS